MCLGGDLTHKVSPTPGVLHVWHPAVNRTVLELSIVLSMVLFRNTLTPERRDLTEPSALLCRLQNQKLPEQEGPGASLWVVEAQKGTGDVQHPAQSWRATPLTHHGLEPGLLQPHIHLPHCPFPLKPHFSTLSSSHVRLFCFFVLAATSAQSTSSHMQHNQSQGQYLRPLTQETQPHIGEA